MEEFIVSTEAPYGGIDQAMVEDLEYFNRKLDRLIGHGAGLDAQVQVRLQITALERVLNMETHINEPA